MDPSAAMPGIEVDPTALVPSLTSLGLSKPVTMLNLYRFNDKPQYTSSSHCETTDISGQEACMTRYIPAWQECVNKHGGATLKFLSTSIRGLVDDGTTGPEHWDAIALVEYRSAQDFLDLLGDEEYVSKALPHRLAAVKEWKLIACA